MNEINLSHITAISVSTQHQIIWSNTIVSIISFICCAVVLILSVKYPGSINCGMKLIISLIVSEIVQDIGNVLSLFLNDLRGLCLLQGFLREVGSVSAIVWFVALSYITYAQVKHYECIREEYFKKILITGALISLPIGIMYALVLIFLNF